MPATSSKRIQEIDTLKGIAIFLVILGHSIIFKPINLHEHEVCNTIFLFLSSVHMQLFFLISGFCFSYHGDYRTFLSKKTKRLLVPYLVFNLLDMIPRYLVPQLVNRPRPISESLYLVLTDGGELWFLYVLYLLFLFYPFLYLWMKKNPSRVILILLSFLLLSKVVTTPLFRLYALVYYAFFFTLGVGLKLTCGSSLFKKSLTFPVRLAGFLTFAIMWYIWLHTHNFQGGLLSPFLGIITCYFACQFDAIHFIFNRFGPYTLQLYILNGFTLVFARTLICNVLGVSNPYVIVAFNTFVCLYVTYLGIKYICTRLPFARTVMGMD